MSDFLPKLMSWDRRPDDFYATPGEGTQALVDFLIAREHIHRGDLVLEPASGEGHIALVLTVNGFQVVASDLRDDVYGIAGQDYLGRDPDGEEDRQYDAVLTNPPFMHALSFIRVALSEAPLVCMLLKMDYWNAAERADFFEANRPTYILPLCFRLAFAKEERGNSPFMNCMWCVWIHGDYRGEVHLLKRPEVFLNVDAASPIRELLVALAENADVRR
jgi:hypothetical protein